jgi:6-phospho-beta-glucosidase
MTKLAILGGSSPFTAAFIDALAQAARRLPRCALWLHGRNGQNLESISRYGAVCLEPLGWSVNSTALLREALEGAYIVIHQIRYGGLKGRAKDERIAADYGAAADETLGPSALNCILRTVPELRDVSRQIALTAPEAWVLNLTNPLSAVTAIMLDCGVARCVGLCELPLYTASLAADVLGVPFHETHWQYAGLNHRGFIMSLEHGGRDLLPELAARLDGDTIGGITAREVSELGALPTKYFQVACGRERPQAGRAAVLSALRDQIAAELLRNASTTPPSIRKRYLEWYSLSVVPMVVALHSSEPKREIVNVRVLNGLVEEVHANVSCKSIDALPSPAITSASVQRWIEDYRAHEKGVMRCIENPSPTSIAAALLADPISPPAYAKPMADAIWTSYQMAMTTGETA